MDRTTAQKRNYNLFRLSGMCLNSDVMTLEEKEIHDEMMALKDKLKRLITLNNKVEAKNPIKFTCWCGRRTSIERFITVPWSGKTMHVCKHHAGEEYYGNS